MEVIVEKYQQKDLGKLVSIWNEVVEEADAFPQAEPLTEEAAQAFFAAQDYVGVARAEDRIVGLYILHPNNVGRCGHQANASYAVCSGARGAKIGERLVKDSLEQARRLGYRLLIFNAVVKGNQRAIRLYEKLGFVKIGEVPGGFLQKNGTYQDTILFYYDLWNGMEKQEGLA